jgi:hypothetical protein
MAADEVSIVEERSPHRSISWRTEEDAHVLWLREERGEVSWKRIESILNLQLPATHHTASAISERCSKYLQPEAYSKGRAHDKDVCDELRGRALSWLEACPPDVELYNEAESILGARSQVRKWTVAEDANVLWLREKYGKMS